MARASGAATTVLESLRILYDLGAQVDVPPGGMIAAMEQAGIYGFEQGEEAYLLMVGTVLRLMLRHAGAEVDEMLAQTAADLEQLGQDIDNAKFEEIVSAIDPPAN